MGFSNCGYPVFYFVTYIYHNKKNGSSVLKPSKVNGCRDLT